MNVSNITTQVSKIVGFIMTIAFSLVAFVHGQNCTWWSWGIINDGQTVTGYSSILRTNTGQDYSAGCDQFAGTLTCISWTTLQNPSTYPYTLAQCQAGVPKDCDQRSWWIIHHGQTVFGYSTTWAEFPKTCDDNFSAPLSCMNGVINGNRQTYKYTALECTNLNTLISGIDIAIDESPWLSATSNLIAQGSSPEVQIIFKNQWDTSLIRSNVAAGFLKCARDEQDLVVYQSRVLSSFVVNSWTKVGVNIRIAPIFSQSLGQKTLTCTIYPNAAAYTDANTNNNKRTTTVEVVEARRFDLALSRSIEPISKNLEAAEGAVGTQWLQNFLFDKIMNVLVPLIVIIGILSAILWFYKLMFSSDENAVKEGTRYIVFGIIGIIVIMSAKFIGQNIYDILNPPTWEILWWSIAEKLYNNIVYPFIKFAIYLVLGAMFIILVGRVITFIFGSDADAQKKAGTLIGWNVISMLLIIAAKQIVQAIYGKQQDVVKDVTNLGEIWSWVLADKNIPILYQVINYALWIASLVILIIIIIQTIKLLTKPDDPAQVKNIKNSLLYMFIGILVLGAGYLIVNFAIIN